VIAGKQSENIKGLLVAFLSLVRLRIMPQSTSSEMIAKKRSENIKVLLGASCARVKGMIMIMRMG